MGAEACFDVRPVLDALDPVFVMASVRDELGRIEDFRYRYLNSPALDLVKAAAESPVGQRMLDLYPSSVDNGLFEACCAVVETGEPLTTEVRFDEGPIHGWFEVRVTKCGVDHRWYDIRAAKVGDGAAYTWRDVTERHTSAETLRVSEERYRLLAEHASDVVFLLAPDDTYQWVSPSVTTVLGWGVEEMIGKSSVQFVAAEDQARLVTAREHPLHGIAELAEFRYLKADGSYLWVSGRSTVIESDGVPVGRVVALRDVHQQVDARLAIESAEARYHLLADHASDLVCLAGPDRRLLWVSKTVTDVLGWTADELLGIVISDLAHPDDLAVGAAQSDPAHSPHGTIAPFVIRLRTKAGGYRWMRGTATPNFDDQGRLVNVVTSLHDIDDLVLAQQESESNAAMVRAVLDSSNDAVLLFDRACRVEYVNAAAERLSGIPTADWIGHSLEELGFPAADAARYRAHVGRVFDEAVSHSVESSVEHRDGHRWYEAILAPVFGHDGTVTHVISDSRDITDRHLIESELMLRATHDALTGLVNRNTLLDELDRALAAGARSGLATGVLMVDLDHFKNINDSLGHDVGDRLLVAVAHRLESLVRTGDVVARIGGDEFVVVLRDLADPTDSMRQAQRILEAFRSPVADDERELHATTSIGIAISSTRSTAEDLIREADTALYVAKEDGRDRASIFNDDLRATVSARLDLECQLRPALERGEFAVWYQPEVHLATGDVVAVEALLRWHHPSGEVYTADRFIDAAEGIGLITELGDWAMRKACTQAAAWNASRPASPLTLRVNLSARQLGEVHLLQTVTEALDVSGLDPARLCLEITEPTLLIRTPIAKSNLAAIGRHGIRIAIDDFGTGYASLADLRDLHVDVIKIGRTVVTNIATDDRDRRLVDGIIALALRLGIHTTAEGVEQPQQAEILHRLGCDTAQGFVYAPALTPTELERFRDLRTPIAGAALSTLLRSAMS